MKEKSSEEKILEASLKEFAEHGFTGARVDRIADAAKINKAMIYYHFKGKEALYERVLMDLIDHIYAHMKIIILDGKDSPEVLSSFIREYIKLWDNMDENIMRTMLREFASGGKYIQKLIVPNLIMPMFSMIEPLLKSQKKKKMIKDIDPQYTFIQVVGSIIFFNMLKNTLKDSEIHDVLFRDNYLEVFTNNLLEIFQSGIQLKGD